MAKDKAFEHHSGVIRVGDRVCAFVPAEDGKRFVTYATVEKINKKTITVLYSTSGGFWEITVPPRYFYLHMKYSEVLIDGDALEELEKDSHILAALQGAGVDNWDGYDEAMEDLA